MAEAINPIDTLVTGLQTLNAKNASKIATRGALSGAVQIAANTGFLPGRKVYDPVSGQYVEVVGSATAYLTQDQLPGD